MTLPTLPPAARSWVYGIVTAAIPILVIAGVISGEEAAMWLNLAAAILGIGASGTAVLHRPTKA